MNKSLDKEFKKKTQGGLLKRITSNQLFIPIMAILLLSLINLINDPSFFKITLLL